MTDAVQADDIGRGRDEAETGGNSAVDQHQRRRRTVSIICTRCLNCRLDSATIILISQQLFKDTCQFYSRLLVHNHLRVLMYCRCIHFIFTPHFNLIIVQRALVVLIKRIMLCYMLWKEKTELKVLQCTWSFLFVLQGLYTQKLIFWCTSFKYVHATCIVAFIVFIMGNNK